MILLDQIAALDSQIAILDKEIARRAREDETARRLMTIPGIGTAAPVGPQRSEGRWTRGFLASARNACKQAGEEIGGTSVAAKAIRRSRSRPTKPFEETVMGADW